MKGKNSKKITLITTIIILTLSTLRIYASTTIPTFHGDELRRAETVSRIIQGQEIKHPTFSIGPIPIFVKTDAGFSSTLFLAPASAWASLFGTSPVSLRIFIAIIITLALILLAHTIALWYRKSRPAFLLAVTLALTLPWLIIQGFIFWDTSLAPIFFILAFYAFTKLKFASKTPKYRHLILLTLSLVLAAYNYLPSAIPAVTLYAASLIYLIKTKIYQPKHVILTLSIAALASLPFIIFWITFPEAHTRSGELNIFYQANLFTGLSRLIDNFSRLLGPAFLFINGDPSPRHGLVILGTLSPLAILPIFWSLFYRIKNLFNQNEKLLFAISLIGILAATFSSALTDPNSQPHSLRANAAAPFFILLIFLGTEKFLQRHPRAIIPVYLALALSTITYYLIFFLLYPRYGHEFFT